MKRTGWGFVLGTGCALMVAACGAGPEDLGGTESVKMRISLAGDACGVTSAEATVSAPDLPPSYPQSLYVGNGYIEGYLSNIPSGAGRRVDVRAYNQAGLEVYAGTTFVDVSSGSVAYAQLQLMRNQRNCPGGGTGDIYIIGTLEGTGPDWDAGYDAGPGPSYDAGVYDAGVYDAGVYDAG
ncbi:MULTISPECIES: hypothetical protein [unclassified Corallococcus]|uniref:hypothetical protein n=1 Tax=unclassified Corallococcus TaxID=2685029 RepID=UPI001A8D98D2|nr:MULTISPECIES: hypothetical protein [unclassified Corallococcus]MBN9682536.1 hypothetical protein [Corallococcus sp. NCSPR001]WAS85912.1 hypothetical protein O0N60_02835 [Corallococcus sp. NCRR]